MNDNPYAAPQHQPEPEPLQETPQSRRLWLGLFLVWLTSVMSTRFAVQDWTFIVAVGGVVLMVCCAPFIRRLRP